MIEIACRFEYFYNEHKGYEVKKVLHYQFYA